MHDIGLRNDLIDRPGVLGNYVPVNYHSLYDLSVLVKGINRVYIQVRKCPNVKQKKLYGLNLLSHTLKAQRVAGHIAS